MNEQHEKMFNEYYKLVYYVINRNFSDLSNVPNYIAYDDIVQHGLIGLFKAVKAFDNEKGFAFSTYATHCIFNEINMVLRKNKPNLEISLNKCISDSDESTIGDLICDNFDGIEDVISEIDTMDTFSKTFNKSNDKVKNVIVKTLEGKTQIQISNETNMSRANVYKLVKSFKDNYKKEMDGRR